MKVLVGSRELDLTWKRRRKKRRGGEKEEEEEEEVEEEGGGGGGGGEGRGGYTYNTRRNLILK